MTSLHVIHDSTLRDHVAKLRELADSIEAGNYGEVGCVAVVVLGQQCTVLGFGPDSEAPSVGMLLHAGFLQLSQSLANHGEEE